MLLESPAEEGSMAVVRRRATTEVHSVKQRFEEVVRDIKAFRWPYIERVKKPIHPHRIKATQAIKKQAQIRAVNSERLLVKVLS